MYTASNLGEELGAWGDCRSWRNPGVVHPVKTMKHTTAATNNLFDTNRLPAIPLDASRASLVGVFDGLKTVEQIEVGAQPNGLRRESSEPRSERSHARCGPPCRRQQSRSRTRPGHA